MKSDAQTRGWKAWLGEGAKSTSLVAGALHAGGKVHRLADGQLWQVQVCLLDIGRGALGHEFVKALAVVRDVASDLQSDSALLNIVLCM